MSVLPAPKVPPPHAEEVDEGDPGVVIFFHQPKRCTKCWGSQQYSEPPTAELCQGGGALAAG